MPRSIALLTWACKGAGKGSRSPRALESQHSNRKAAPPMARQGNKDFIAGMDLISAGITLKGPGSILDDQNNFRPPPSGLARCRPLRISRRRRPGSARFGRPELRRLVALLGDASEALFDAREIVDHGRETDHADR